MAGDTWKTDGSMTFVGTEGTLNLPESGTSVTFHGRRDRNQGQ